MIQTIIVDGPLRRGQLSVAVVANEDRFSRAVIGTAQHGDSLAADLVGVADRAIADQPSGNASLVCFLLYSR